MLKRFVTPLLTSVRDAFDLYPPIPKPIVEQFELTEANVMRLKQSLKKALWLSGCGHARSRVSTQALRALWQTLRSGGMGLDEYRRLRENAPLVLTIFALWSTYYRYSPYKKLSGVHVSSFKNLKRLSAHAFLQALLADWENEIQRF